MTPLTTVTAAPIGAPAAKVQTGLSCLTVSRPVAFSAALKLLCAGSRRYIGQSAAAASKAVAAIRNVGFSIRYGTWTATIPGTIARYVNLSCRIHHSVSTWGFHSGVSARAVRVDHVVGVDRGLIGFVGQHLDPVGNDGKTVKVQAANEQRSPFLC